jgi:pilus assembly protein Flp/PilA
MSKEESRARHAGSRPTLFTYAAFARLREPSRDDGGATATEYALLVGVIALVIVAGVTFFGNNLNDWFTTLGSTVQSYSS